MFFSFEQKCCSYKGNQMSVLASLYCYMSGYFNIHKIHEFFFYQNKRFMTWNDLERMTDKPMTSNDNTLIKILVLWAFRCQSKLPVFSKDGQVPRQVAAKENKYNARVCYNDQPSFINDPKWLEPSRSVPQLFPPVPSVANGAIQIHELGPFCCRRPWNFGSWVKQGFGQ